MGDLAAGSADDTSATSMHCADHSYRAATPGGICVVCLQDKLGKLLTISSPFPPSPPLPTQTQSNPTTKHTNTCTQPYPTVKTSFWSFLHHSPAAGRPAGNPYSGSVNTRPTPDARAACTGDPPDAPAPASGEMGRRVWRSRSLGCGSRSFSGDFLDRLSTGFGDCTLRRVESNREAKAALGLDSAGDGGSYAGDRRRHRRRVGDRVRCGGIFGGFGVLSSVSSYWLSAEDTGIGAGAGGWTLASGEAAPAPARHRSWGWALAGPVRAFRPVISSSSSSSSSKNVISVKSGSVKPARNGGRGIAATNGCGENGVANNGDKAIGGAVD